eukprot:1303761-Lingulodinium_polyedra.AAC.1
MGARRRGRHRLPAGPPATPSRAWSSGGPSGLRQPSVALAVATTARAPHQRCRRLSVGRRGPGAALGRSSRPPNAWRSGPPCSSALGTQARAT